MKVAVDARLMSGHVRGMGQYARMLTKPVADQLWPLLPKVRADEITGEGLAAGWGFEPWWEQVCLPRLARESGASFLLCPANTGPVRRVRGMRTILVIHDLIYMLPTSILPWSTSRYQNLGRIYRRMVVPQAARHADCILTVSHFTRQQLGGKVVFFLNLGPAPAARPVELEDHGRAALDGFVQVRTVHAVFVRAERQQTAIGPQAQIGQGVHHPVGGEFGVRVLGHRFIHAPIVTECPSLAGRAVPTCAAATGLNRRKSGHVLTPPHAPPHPARAFLLPGTDHDHFGTGRGGLLGH